MKIGQSISLASPGFFHVYNRGVNRQKIFQNEDDYCLFLSLVADSLGLGGVFIHGFTLMPNHFHFILEQKAPFAISGFMKKTCEKFSRTVNRAQRRVGHLFQGRFKRKHIEKESYLLTLARYVDLNPVHSRLVSAPGDWRFGSTRSYLSADAESFVRTDTILGLIGGREAYAGYLNQPPEPLGSEIENLLIDREVL